MEDGTGRRGPLRPGIRIRLRSIRHRPLHPASLPGFGSLRSGARLTPLRDPGAGSSHKEGRTRREPTETPPRRTPSPSRILHPGRSRPHTYRSGRQLSREVPLVSLVGGAVLDPDRAATAAHVPLRIAPLAYILPGGQPSSHSEGTRRAVPAVAFVGRHQGRCRHLAHRQLKGPGPTRSYRRWAVESQNMPRCGQPVSRATFVAQHVRARARCGHRGLGGPVCGGLV